MKVSADSYFAIVPEWLLDADVSDRAVRVYALLSRYADQRGHAHPSRATLARRCKCSTRSIDRALRELEAVQSVTIKHRYSKDDHSLITSEYIVRRNTPQKSRTLGTVVSLGGRDARVA